VKAAVLHTLGKPPRFEDFPDPQPRSNEAKVRVKAASLKNIDKAMANGSPRQRRGASFAATHREDMGRRRRQCFPC
jgi:NADPH:quinone reductase-like Zn-dependent oxidoreductase